MRKNAVISILLVLVVIIILAFIVVSDYIQNKSSRPPQLIVSEEEWDFGMVKPNEKPTQILPLKMKERRIYSLRELEPLVDA